METDVLEEIKKIAKKAFERRSQDKQKPKKEEKQETRERSEVKPKEKVAKGQEKEILKTEKITPLKEAEKLPEKPEPIIPLEKPQKVMQKPETFNPDMPPPAPPAKEAPLQESTEKEIDKVLEKADRPVRLEKDIEYLKTNIDRLLELVIKKGKVSSLEASRKFDVSIEKIEEWGKILEEHDLLELHYPTFGKPILKIKKPKKTKEEIMKEHELARKEKEEKKERERKRKETERRRKYMEKRKKDKKKVKK